MLCPTHVVRAGAVAAAFFLIVAPAHAVLGPNYFGTASEPFDYLAGTTLGPIGPNGGARYNAAGNAALPNDADAFWGNTSLASGVPPSTGAGGSRMVAAGSLNYSAVGYAPSSGGRAVIDGGFTNISVAVGRSLKQQVSAGEFWFSYLTERNNQTTRTTNFAFFGPVTSPSSTPAGTDDRFAIGQLGINLPGTVNSGGNFVLEFNGNNPASVVQPPTPIPYGANVTHLILGRVQFDNGAANATTGGVNDTVSVWIDPANVSSFAVLGAPSIASNSYDILVISAIRLFAGGLNNMGAPNTEVASTDFDEIRFGSSLKSVTVPEPALLAMLTLPAATLGGRLRRRNR